MPVPAGSKPIEEGNLGQDERLDQERGGGRIPREDMPAPGLHEDGQHPVRVVQEQPEPIEVNPLPAGESQQHHRCRRRIVVAQVTAICRVNGRQTKAQHERADPVPPLWS